MLQTQIILTWQELIRRDGILKWKTCFTINRANTSDSSQDTPKRLDNESVYLCWRLNQKSN